MTGPCLCGDPYCPRCGDPAAAILEELANNAADDMLSFVTTPEEVRIFELAGYMAVYAHREAHMTEMAEVMADQQEYIRALQDQIRYLQEINEE